MSDLSHCTTCGSIKEMIQKTGAGVCIKCFKEAGGSGHLSTATGKELDQLGELFGVSRGKVESDSLFRVRVRLACEKMQRASGSPFDGRVKKELVLRTPWLDEVDEL